MTKQNAEPTGIALDMLSHVSVELEAYVGSARMTVGELTALRADGVITLSSRVGQDVDIRLNGTTVAMGELVAVDDHFAVRITGIARP